MDKRQAKLLDKKLLQLQQLINQGLLYGYYNNDQIADIDICNIEQIRRTKNKDLIQIFFKDTSKLEVKIISPLEVPHE